MRELFRNNSPGALTRAQAVEIAKKQAQAERAERRRMAENLARQGRGGDTEIAHMARGEIVLPEVLQTPEVLNALRRVASEKGMALERYRIGSERNSINPNTGAPEFFDFSIWPAKEPYDMCNIGSQMERCEGWVPNFLKDKPSRYMPTPEDLAKLPDAQKERYAEYYEGTGGAEDMMAKGLGPVRGLLDKVGRPVARGIGKILGVDGASREEIAKAYRGSLNRPRSVP